jgi:hypothetical protein
MVNSFNEAVDNLFKYRFIPEEYRSRIQLDKSIKNTEYLSQFDEVNAIYVYNLIYHDILFRSYSKDITIALYICLKGNGNSRINIVNMYDEAKNHPMFFKDRIRMSLTNIFYLLELSKSISLSRDILNPFMFFCTKKDTENELISFLKLLERNRYLYICWEQSSEKKSLQDITSVEIDELGWNTIEGK